MVGEGLAQGPQSPGMLQRTLRRVLAAIGLGVLVLTATFVVFHVLPGDPVRSALGVHASETAVVARRAELGLDRPLVEQYLRFMQGAAMLDFGRSFQTREEVRAVLLSALGLTAAHAAAAIAIAALVGMLVVMATWVTKGWVRRCTEWICRLATSVPSLVLSVAVGLWAYQMLDFMGAYSTASRLSAILALSVYPTLSLIEVAIRATERLESALCAIAARGQGMTELRVFVHVIVHGIRMAWLGQLSNLMVSLFVSSAVFEVVFSLHGLGYLLHRAVASKDFPVMQGVVVTLLLTFLALDALFEQGILRPLAARYGR